MEADKHLHHEAAKHLKSTKSAVKEYYEDRLVDRIKSEPKVFYNYARHFTRSSSTIDTLEHDGVKVTEDSAKADILNTFFASVMCQEPEITWSLPLPGNESIQPTYGTNFSSQSVQEMIAGLNATELVVQTPFT